MRQHIKIINQDTHRTFSMSLDFASQSVRSSCSSRRLQLWMGTNTSTTHLHSIYFNKTPALRNASGIHWNPGILSRAISHSRIEGPRPFRSCKTLGARGLHFVLPRTCHARQIANYCSMSLVLPMRQVDMGLLLARSKEYQGRAQTSL